MPHEQSSAASGLRRVNPPSKVTHKTCRECGVSKTFGLFGRELRGKYGIKTVCKECQAIYVTAWRKENKEKVSGYGAAYREKNKEKRAESLAAWREKNREKISAYEAEYRENNKERIATYRENTKDAQAERNRQWVSENRATVNASAAKRRVRKVYPLWVSEEGKEGIALLYEQAQCLTKSTGVEHHVDHDIPLQGKWVSGFHAPNNLAVLPATVNWQKHASFNDKGWIPGSVWLASLDQPYSSYPSFVRPVVIRRRRRA